MIVVQKYGGSSVATVESIKRVATRVVVKQQEGYDVVVVISAMGNTTDELLDLSRKVASNPSRRDLDLLLSTGEIQSAALLSMAIQDLGVPAVALSGRQCGILTNGVHMNARILEIHPERILKELGAGRIVVAAGFQGVSSEDDLTTLGRGGSDLTAIALAAAVEAEHCEILTDVEGVFDADPRVVDNARCLDRVSHHFLEEFACHGARVLKDEAVEFARDHGIAVRVLSTFGSGNGTTIDSVRDARKANPRSFHPKRSEYTGVAGRRDLLRISFEVPQKLSGASLFDMIAQYNLVFGGVNTQGRCCTIYLSTEEIPNVDNFSETLGERFGTNPPQVSEVLGALTLVGFGLGSRPAALHEATRVLDEAKIEVHDTFTGRESLTFVVDVEKIDEGMRTLHSCYLENGAGDEREGESR